ncbi:short-chain dehydrogenase/reductase SDR [Deinococcus proteolyticus MRP]|uniref:Short-chain dehydrogenase/reductase SDR n=1 Tax=Deinococcus proteolyticus (strain ATCC 35074 / DSM 20540 / JCM 6276 / NBRC 101906 / NCIMB 13154 / VKM Ac-1939 / CCM 2703 / MRP) TaxID=693977 RepID=F0RMG9_DEIPM|nr:MULTISPECIES: SDR family oxidoreductase [Deinococcus]ADY26019.1 short-chain dehydrogenase/reductase SDR [Deinococcus proteolyticus MRP]MCY1702140.1 SDR family oxidoreductase [Deinococcus sp. SL84]
MTSAPAPRPLTLITGATGGIGRATAFALAPDHDLILQGRSRAALEDLQREVQLQHPHTRTELLELDLLRPDTFAAAADLRPTHLVHNAGVAELGAVAKQTHDRWTWTLAVNVVAPAELTRLLLPSVQAARGTIVFINSGAGLRANAGWASYAASKHALKALADALRQEVADSGVRVASLYPGRTATPMQQAIREQEEAAYDPAAFIQPATVADVVRYVLAAPRDVSLDDVAVRPGPR